MKKIVFILVMICFPTIMTNISAEETERTMNEKASILQKDPVVEKPMYKITFGNGNWALTDGQTGKPSTGLYAAGERVVLWYEFVATDTNYYFYIDGQEIQPSGYTHKTGFIFEFMMPYHDIHFEWEERNTMLYEVESDIISR